MIPARSGLIHEGQGQAGLHLILNSTTRGPTKGVQFNRIMRHAVIDDIEKPAVSQAAPISATTRSIAAASPRPRPAAPIIGMYEKSLASAAVDRLRSFS
jgi:hypothetical protein